MISKTLILTVFLTGMASFAAACIDDFNEGKSFHNQGVANNNEASKLYQWVTDNDSDLSSSQYCAHITDIRKFYSEASYSFRRAVETLDKAASQCRGDNRTIVINTRSLSANNLQHTLTDGEMIQGLFYEYCS